MSTRSVFLLVSAAIIAVTIPIAARQKVSLKPDFKSLARLVDWNLDGSGTWTIADGILILQKAGTPAGAIRRPSALAILKSDPMVHVTVQTEIRSTAPVDVPERDLEVIFDYQSPSRFYYVHLAGVTNDVHNGIFVVNDQDRKRIDPGTTPPQLKDQAWHMVRVERDGVTGAIRVFVDGSKTPVMEATDKTLASGRVGLGSFDDTGEFRNVVVAGTEK